MLTDLKISSIDGDKFCYKLLYNLSSLYSLSHYECTRRHEYATMHPWFDLWKNKLFMILIICNNKVESIVAYKNLIPTKIMCPIELSDITITD